MFRLFLLILVGTSALTILFFNGETFLQGAAQSTLENSSNLTYPNNPTMTTGEMLNGTNTGANNSNESDKNLPSPM